MVFDLGFSNSAFRRVWMIRWAQVVQALHWQSEDDYLWPDSNGPRVVRQSTERRSIFRPYITNALAKRCMMLVSSLLARARRDFAVTRCL